MKLVQAFILIVLINFSTAFISKADPVNTPDLLTKANQLYKENKFSEAISLYQKIEKSGIQNGDLFYNIGNSYAKNNNTGMAKAYYLKAQKYIPSDTDLKANLDLVNNKVLDKTELSLKDKISKKIFIWNNFFNAEELTIIFLILWSLLWIIIIFRKKPGAKESALLKTGFSFIALLTFIFALSYLLKMSSELEKNAVVVVQEADIKTGIDSNSITLFKLHEGTELKVLQKSDNWTKIEFSPDKRGWIQNASIYEI